MGQSIIPNKALQPSQYIPSSWSTLTSSNLQLNNIKTKLVEQITDKNEQSLIDPFLFIWFKIQLHRLTLHVPRRIECTGPGCPIRVHPRNISALHIQLRCCESVEFDAGANTQSASGEYPNTYRSKTYDLCFLSFKDSSQIHVWFKSNRLCVKKRNEVSGIAATAGEGTHVYHWSP